jgi:hypothetical protein
MSSDLAFSKKSTPTNYKYPLPHHSVNEWASQITDGRFLAKATDNILKLDECGL